jgi:hypothetical protein
MTKYYVLTEGQVDQIAETIKAAILRAIKPLNLPVEPGQAKAEKQAQTRGRSGKKKLAAIIYESIEKEPFTAQEAFSSVQGKYEFKGDRGLDSVRYSLRTDSSRFIKLEDGRFQRVSKKE